MSNPSLNVRSTTLLNLSGDSTITWTADNDDVMKEIIEKKMREGIVFFIVKPRLLGFGSKKTEIGSVDEAMTSRAVSVRDEDFARVIATGTAELVKRQDNPFETVRKAESAEEAATHQTVAVQQMRGG